MPNRAHTTETSSSSSSPPDRDRSIQRATGRARQLASLYKSARSSPAKVSPTDTAAPPINRTRTQRNFPFTRISSARAQGVFSILFHEYFSRQERREGKKKLCANRYISIALNLSRIFFFEILFSIESCRPQNRKKIRNIFPLLSLVDIVAPTVKYKKV